ncbi:MAG: insulinase family protein [Saprospiraceae bacterium]|nr:insulinase family protein [Saprospiraceae bacterium]
MNIPNRQQGPRIFSDYNIQLPSFKSTMLANDLELIELNDGSQEIIRVDYVYKSGRVNESVRASAKASFYLLREGTRNTTAHQIAEKFDYYGAYIRVFAGLEYSSLSLVVMSKYFEEVWPVFLEMITDPDFTEDELSSYKRIYSEKLRNELSKNDVLAYRRLTEIIFGDQHPYGYNTEPSDILALKLDQVNAYRDTCHGTNNALAVISGKYSEKVSELCKASLGAIDMKTSTFKQEFFNPDIKHVFEKLATDQTVQTSLKIGRKLFKRKHSDFSKMQVANTLLGGYFGSRLMKNIREEKGYTYGIYSSVDVWKEDGFFYISADVSNNAIEPTIEEINKEIKRLQTEPVPDNEFRMVKNFMLGQILHLIDGPFASGQLIKNIYAKELDIEHFKNHIDGIKGTTKNDVMEMARKYLDEKSFITVLAGNF